MATPARTDEDCVASAASVLPMSTLAAAAASIPSWVGMAVTIARPCSADTGEIQILVPAYSILRGTLCITCRVSFPPRLQRTLLPLSMERSPVHHVMPATSTNATVLATLTPILKFTDFVNVCVSLYMRFKAKLSKT